MCSFSIFCQINSASQFRFLEPSSSVPPFSSPLPLTPNQLLLGHTTSEVPDMEYGECDRFSARLNYIRSVHTEWWGRWIEEVLPTLIPCRKWKKRTRNLQVGYVVMMEYKGNLVNDYRLALGLWGLSRCPSGGGIRKRNQKYIGESHYKQRRLEKINQVA